MAEPIALTALALDAAFGWPKPLYGRIGHPVGLFARIVAHCDAWWNRPQYRFAVRRALGILALFVLLTIAAGLGWAAQRLSLAVFGAWGWIGIAILAWPALAQRSLFDHVRAVGEQIDADDLAQARTAVGLIVGRDTAALDAAGVARAAIESLAESFCDGIAAPLFWLLLLGLPGIWAYKAVNTADSLIGHREDRWRAFGWAAARTDDLANWIPARLAGVLICVSGGRGWRILRRDAHRHASPNAGWPEAAMAGALGLRLAGPIAYDGVMHDKPWIGDGDSHAGGEDIDRALAVYGRACLLLWLIAGGASWLR
ncbi:adenosylcobinamide-phosphate synthase CbiB [Sphingopyxis sp. RIFCSPHIGHO2_12_FULL_65_19]|uniref:adenosylcobinamide-phosphate synthase CbiB n=1 Tax=Sphingopyxis sp. RIFCSPHIGHO2_12_FULL_65_19 TaxID=1802172 RepID=UPI0008B30135|nr:adenosylcobinamide-phosphate synthase CbiB [Sphingopyxis sp. RIFCSPHIGHO2_12_FULL_65_19]OHD08061.1 MAG: cobalamin biosynthesis protein CobD [Sphingopyxis sp. RIFCSPHIGHO2_12_FULL_65_19]